MGDEGVVFRPQGDGKQKELGGPLCQKFCFSDLGYTLNSRPEP